MRRYLASVRLASSRICAFADDLAIVLASIAQQLPEIIVLFGALTRATGLTLHARKCLLIPLRHDMLPQEFASTYPFFGGIAIQDIGKYLGVYVGPGAPQLQWVEVLRMMRLRIEDIRVSRMGIPARAYMHNCYVASLFRYKSQFAALSDEALSDHSRRIPRLLNAPWQSITYDMACAPEATRPTDGIYRHNTYPQRRDTTCDTIIAGCAARFLGH